MRKTMKQTLAIAVLACLAGSAFAAYDAEYTWVGHHFEGDSVTFNSVSNWSTDWQTFPETLPGTNSLVRIQAMDWLENYPTLSGTAACSGVYLGLNTEGLPGASLTITETGNLSTTTHWVEGPDFWWNPGIQIGWYSDATVISAGTVTTLNAEWNGWTELGKGGFGYGFGDGTLIITDGSWTTDVLSYALDSENHVQLIGGILELWEIINLEGAGQTMDLSGGTLLYHTTNVNWFSSMTASNVGLTANGNVAFLEGTHSDTDGDTTNDLWTVISLAAQSPRELYTTWATNFVGLVDTNMMADPDNDLVSNLGEYGFGGDPTDGNNRGLVPTTEILNVEGIDYFVYITYERDDKLVRGLAYNVEQTLAPVLSEWTSGVPVLGGVNPLNENFNFVTNFISTVDEGEQFLRLRVEFTD